MTAKHIPTVDTRAMVSALASYGVPQDDICKVIGISKPTLHLNYRDEIDLSAIKANAAVAQTLYVQATDVDHPKSTAAAMFWMKVRAGWKEVTIVDNTSSDGSMTPKPTKIEFVSPQVTDESDD